MPSRPKSEQYFCSRSCWYSYIAVNGYPRLESKTCLFCKKEFKPERNRQRFCDRYCYKQYIESNHNWSWKGGKPNCSICGEEMSSYNKKGNVEKGDALICKPCRGKGYSPWGEDHYNFKGYSTSKKAQGKALKTWKNRLLMRDNYQCVKCGFNEIECLQGCHIIARHKDFSRMIELNNGVILCANCHILFDKGYFKIDYPYNKENL